MTQCKEAGRPSHLRYVSYASVLHTRSMKMSHALIDCKMYVFIRRFYSSALTRSVALAAWVLTCSVALSALTLAAPAASMTACSASLNSSPAASYASSALRRTNDERMLALILSSSSLVGASEGEASSPAILRPCQPQSKLHSCFENGLTWSAPWRASSRPCR